MTSIKVFFSFFLSFLTLSQMTMAQDEIKILFKTEDTKAFQTLQDFLVLLRAEEARLPKHYDMKMKVTALRKLFYASAAYDRFLIPGAAAIPAPYPMIKEITVPNFDKKLAKNGIKVTDTITYPTDSTGQIPMIRNQIYSSQEVIVGTQMLSDIGHVLCGLDAFSHLHEVVPPKILGIQLTRIKVNSNHDAITWVGEIGSAIAEIYFAEKIAKCTNQKVDKQQIFNNLASPADLIGDIDSYVMAPLLSDFSSVSDMIEAYYLSNDSNIKVLREQRYLLFAKTIGLKWNGVSFENLDEKLRFYSDQINDSAALYYAVSAKRGGKWNTIKALPSIFKMSRNKNAKILGALFFEALAKEIRK